MLPRPAWWRPAVGGGAALAVAAVVLFLILWAPVLTGHRDLIGGDILYQLPPWSGATGADRPRNPIVSDPVLQMLPWQMLVRDAFAHLRLPLWNDTSLSGAPLLANDQSASFSPFTWLALPFEPGRGLSLAMLAKLWVAAAGMALFVRTLGARPVASVLAGIIYAGSSYMVVWLAWPQSAVAALIPFGFAAVEWYVRSGRRLAIVGLAFVIALQFFGGHAETSLHMGGALALYALVRVLALPRLRIERLAGLLVAATAGSLVAGLQLAPFVALLGRSSLSADRAAAGFGLAHLPISDLSTWLIPNAKGNPGIDGLLGRAPNYSESTGFTTVAALVLAPIGLWWGWARERAAVLALTLIAVLAAGIVYGPLTPIMGRLPGLSVSGNERLLSVLPLVAAALAGLGLEAMLERQLPLRRWLSRILYVAGAAGLVALAGSAILLLRRGSGVDRLLPSGPRAIIGFWLLVALLSLGTAVAFAASWLMGMDGRFAAAAIAALVLAEVGLFAGPFNPRVPPNEVPPASEALNWLRANADQGSVAALGLTFAPNSATLYGIRDARGYDVLIDRRQRAFWSTADPGYHDERLLTLLEHPDPRFLAAAGVTHIMTPGDAVIPGTMPAFVAEGVVIAQVPGARPFAFIAAATVTVPDSNQAKTQLAADPLGPVVVERCCAGSAAPVPGPDQAAVAVKARQPGAIDLDVSAASPGTLVVLQSYAPGWVARIDGRRATVEAADILFQSVHVPAGHHLVTLRYEPLSVAVGGLMTALGLVALVLIGASGRWSRWRRRARGQIAP